MNLRLFFRMCTMGEEKEEEEARDPSIHPSVRPFIHSSIHPSMAGMVPSCLGVRVRRNQEGRYEGESEQLSRNDIRDDGISSVKTSCRQDTCYCLPRLPACAYIIHTHAPLYTPEYSRECLSFLRGSRINSVGPWLYKD